MEKKEIEELKKKLEECQKEKEEFLEGWQRARADFLNYKKEEKKRIEKIWESANRELILEILPLMDNLEQAQREISPQKEESQYIKGFLQIKRQLESILESQGVKPIKCKGKKFDPQIQEVVERVERKDKPSGTIVQVLRKGYTIDSKLLRPAKVKVVK